MKRELLIYPNPKIRDISANVRFFDDELKSYVADMIDTAKEHGLVALSAIEIAIQYNIIIIKADSDYDIFINSRIIRHEKPSTKTERSRYYPGISADIDRYDFISIVYEDIDGNSHSKELIGDEARLFQIQLDYSFGSTFVDRCDKEMKERIANHLEFGLVGNNTSCPTVFYRDYFKKFARYIMMLMALTLFSPLFIDNTKTIFIADMIGVLLVVVSIIGYIIYALYESRKYKQCTSCQAGNIVGTSIILSSWLLFVSILVLIFLKP